MTTLDKITVDHTFKLSDFKLCYVSDQRAYFTSHKDVQDQWGDDWDDQPYEYNAGRPYKDSGAAIVEIAYDSEMITPDTGYQNSPFSVKIINSGVIAWLRCDQYSNYKTYIMAGTTLPDFITKIKEIGGEVYLPSRLVIQSSN